MPDFSSLFTGGGGADLGAVAAGFTPVAANEIDPSIAEVYKANVGPEIRVGNILEQDPRSYPRCDLLHASPPCPNFSRAKTGAEETALDIAMAEKVSEFIRVLEPRAFTLENVPAYRHSRSYKIILRELSRAGYMYDARILCAADYGVPQTRRRFFMRASRSLIRAMPAPVPWMGWYAAIEDIIPTLKESEFAPWQLARIPGELLGNILVEGRNAGGGKDCTSDEPAQTVTSIHFPRAFMVDGQNTTPAERLTIRDANEPAYTVVSSTVTKGIGRAWLSQGRVVKMNLRALARFQSFPDWYRGLTGKIIGNAVPPLMYAAVARSLIE